LAEDAQQPVNTLYQSGKVIVKAAHLPSKRKRKIKKLTAIDLFAGAGGFSLAAQLCGLEVAVAVELDPHACATYRSNLIEGRKASTTLLEGDIRDVDWKAVLKKAKLAKGDCDLLLGGPPCQGFSTHRLKGAGIDDPRNELLGSYFESVQAIRPAAFLIENVPGLLWQRHEAYLKKLLAAAKAAKYKVFSPIVLNARSYGAPQNRKRVFVLGFRDDIAAQLSWPPPPSHLSPDDPAVAAKVHPAWLTASTVFSKPFPPDDENDLHMQHSAAMIDVFKSTPSNGGSRSESNRILTCHLSHNGHKDVYGRIDPTKPGPTMTTACINPSKGRFLHPTRNHGICLRHAARFQTFPDDFVFGGGIIAAGRQIGNAVPITTGVALISAIKRALIGASKANMKHRGRD
jgi:DNA (cytosine-5)-methyltransferase 1